LGVLGVGSLVYLPLNSDPPILVCVPMAILTGATLPADVAPTEAFSIIS